jgi:hypothetical protein
MAPKTGLNVEIRDLYRLAPEEFTTARNALASRLGKEKRKNDAAEVKALPKPTPSAWAVNALFERQEQKMDALIAAGKRAREAVSGRGADSPREAIRIARGLVDQLRGDAIQILSEHGRPPSRDLVERIAANLQAIAFSPAASEEVSRGWLDHDLDPPGFEVLAGMPPAGSAVVDMAGRRPQLEKKKVKEKEDEERRKENRAAEEKQRQEEERRRQQIAAAEEKVEQARSEAEPLREEAERLESEAVDARRMAEKAEQAAAKARDKADRAAERLALAKEELRKLQ